MSRYVWDSNYLTLYPEKKSVDAPLHRSTLSSFHPSMPAAILSSASSVKSTSNLCFPFMFTSKVDTHTQIDVQSIRFCLDTHSLSLSLSHPFSSPSDELLSCLLDSGSIQPQSRQAANHRTMRLTSTSPACSAFAGRPFNRQPSENLSSRWLGGAWWAGHQWRQKKAALKTVRKKETSINKYTIKC